MNTSKKKKKRLLSGICKFLSVLGKTGSAHIDYFLKIGLCSAISLKRSRRELTVDVAEHRFIL